ncbi:hypothetical protein L210DRAFT_394206 [Boletus edulis BED1]|uniref:Uncharacterized protein n=1 Tax=Boletus edulis BED1 TaxID=1328754 RepID=A0AAD4BXI7_BOLED|nr:hypothetical protein L210DRAFT_394206 [Boletus edulis BED1]
MTLFGQKRPNNDFCFHTSRSLRAPVCALPNLAICPVQHHDTIVCLRPCRGSRPYTTVFFRAYDSRICKCPSSANDRDPRPYRMPRRRLDWDTGSFLKVLCFRPCIRSLDQARGCFSGGPDGDHGWHIPHLRSRSGQLELRVHFHLPSKSDYSRSIFHRSDDPDWCSRSLKFYKRHAKQMLRCARLRSQPVCHVPCPRSRQRPARTPCPSSPHSTSNDQRSQYYGIGPWSGRN